MAYTVETFTEIPPLTTELEDVPFSITHPYGVTLEKWHAVRSPEGRWEITIQFEPIEDATDGE